MYLNCGWCYGGFKATPASGWTFAWTIAKDEPHDFNAPFTLDRFHRGLVIDDKGQGEHPVLITCPYCGPRDVIEFTYQGDGNRERPDPASQNFEAWNAYVYDRLNPAGDHNEIWQHSGGCRAHLRVVRNTLTHEISSVAFVRGDHGGGQGMSPRRTTAGGQIDRLKTVRFTFDGAPFTGHAGDTLASALLAKGVTLFGRSFKYHRPRGILSAGAEEPNALVEVVRDAARKQPNVRATVQELYDGLTAKSQNRWPSLAFDIGAVNNLFAPFFAAGFYYKTFMWPKAAWHKIYEPRIRAAAGLGVAPKEGDPDHYANRFAHCDVLVAGGGAAGIAAALAAAETGASVIIADERAQFGGALHFDTGVTIDGMDGFAWAQTMVARLAAMPNVRVLSRTTVFGYYAQNFIGLVERVTDHIARPGRHAPRERLWQVRAKRVILATGAIERHMVFDGNDRPGVMLASAARMYLNHYGVAVGAKVGVYTSHDSAYEAAFDLKAAGVQIPAIVDSRDRPGDAVLQQARALGITVMTGSAVIGTKGNLRINSMTVARRGMKQGDKIAVDVLLMSSGWTPS
eukprot:gene34926-46916_t